VRHPPCRLVGAANLPLQFLRRDAMASAGHEVHREEPVRELRPALMEDGPRARVDVEAAMLAGIGPALRHGVKTGAPRGTEDTSSSCRRN